MVSSNSLNQMCSDVDGNTWESREEPGAGKKWKIKRRKSESFMKTKGETKNKRGINGIR